MDVKRALAPLLIAVALAAIAVAGWWTKRPADVAPVACADAVAGCAFTHRSQRVTLAFSARPTPLEAFEIRVVAPEARTVRAEFQMVGMDMGFNRYDLRPTGNARFAARVTLPVCVSGRRDWTLILDIDGTRYGVPFSTG